MGSQETPTEEKLIQRKDEFNNTRGKMFFMPISFQQSKTAIDFPAKGQTWVSRVEIPAPSENDLVEVIMGIIQELGDGTEVILTPTCENVKVQWTGYRPGAAPREPEPAISAGDKYAGMMKDTQEKITLFYAHGGFN